MNSTLQEHQAIIKICKNIFEQKNKDYDTSWRILRPSSCTDQILIKAKRIRTIQELGRQEINDDINTELIGIVNYAIIALLQMQLPPNLTIQKDQLSQLYDTCIAEIQSLLRKKNHDYNEIWREMRTSSLVDIILMKLLRIKNIEDNHGKTHISEGIKANYQDIINYATFALIQQGILLQSPEE